MLQTKSPLGQGAVKLVNCRLPVIDELGLKSRRHLFNERFKGRDTKHVGVSDLQGRSMIV